MPGNNLRGKHLDDQRAPDPLTVNITQQLRHSKREPHRRDGLGNRTATTRGAELYRCWIANRRLLEQIIAQIE